ncbi:hypothetical protein NMG60_11014684 [Bertholletia excelsa]
MNCAFRLFFTACLLAVAAFHGAEADAMVTGFVFCDQCKDGQISLFDYPLYGIKVAVTCADRTGKITMSREETTNWSGNYAMKFDGTPDLSRCYARVSGAGQGSGNCGAMAGPAKNLKLMYSIFGTEMYTVDPLLSEPAQPMSFCPKSSSPAPVPLNPPPGPITPANPPPVNHHPIPRLPPLPPLPPMPPFPFVEASACPYWNWTMPEYRCYWKVLTPDTKVAVVFGLVAERKYGPDMTLGQAMQGRADPYRTLLREATTALLNSYNSMLFPYHPLGVIQNLNWALVGSTRQVFRTAIRFRRVNSGNGKVGCRFTPCKN